MTVPSSHGPSIEQPAIEFDHASFRLNGRPLLQDLVLSVKPGETVVLLGRSGSGKTTTLKLINRLLLPTTGDVRVNGRRTAEWDPIRLRRSIGYVIQDGGLFPHFTVERNIAVVPRIENWPQARVEARGPVTGTWDRMRLDTVVTNLLSNAVKYGEGKPVTVRVETEGRAARLTVSDHGIGIAKVDQERIFERFERAVPERHYGGFGVGLWVARLVAEAHGGRLQVRSAPGEGSTFLLELPLAEEVT